MISSICAIEKKMSKRKKETERGEPRNRLLTIENKLMVTRGEVDGTNRGGKLKSILIMMKKIN